MNNNFLLLTPEFIVTGLAFVVLTLDLFLPERHKWTLPFAAISGNAYRLTRNPLSLVAGSLVSI
jgi:hypothetical protein